jgi:Fe2+ transport system protein FeoA
MKADSGPLRLADLDVGDVATVDRTEVEDTTGRFLRAIGLTRRARFRVCRRGEPCIIQVRSTRVGLALAIADRILVTPVDDIKA